jgi:hypothetical protein
MWLLLLYMLLYFAVFLLVIIAIVAIVVKIRVHAVYNSIDEEEFESVPVEQEKEE